MEEGKLTYSPHGKAFEKQVKTIEEQGEKPRKAIEEQEVRHLSIINDKKEDSDVYDNEKDYCF